MSVNLTIAGQSFPFPTVGENNWGQNVTNWATAVSTYLLQRTGGSFALTNDVNFGANFATVQIYLKSRSSNLSTAGFIRMAVGDSVAWRNNANNGNLLLVPDGSNNLTFAGNVLATLTGGAIPVSQGGTGLTSYTIGDMIYASGTTTLSKLAIGTGNYVLVSSGSAPGWGLLVNANIDAAAAIAYSKLALTDSILNADINSSAAIAFSKLAALTSGNILVGSSGNVATSVAMSGDITIDNAGVTAIGSGVIVNADVNASAAIARTKLASGTNYRVLANNSSGVMSENAALTSGHVVIADSNGQLAGEAQLSKTRGGTGISSTATFPSSGTVVVQLPIAVAYRSTNLSVGTGADVDIVWDTEVIDSDNAYNNTTGIFTAPNTGYYRVAFTTGYSVTTDFNGTSEQWIFIIYINGSSYGTVAQITPPSGNFNQRTCAVEILSLAANDQVKILTTQNSGVSQNVIGSVTSRVSFEQIR